MENMSLSDIAAVTRGNDDGDGGAETVPGGLSCCSCSCSVLVA